MNKRKKKSHIEALPIKIAGTIQESIVDGLGVRYVVFVQGCYRNCPGCHNPETHDLKGGILTSTDVIWNEIENNPLLSGVTFSGGEPFLWGHELAVIGRAAREKGLDVYTYTGYTYEELLEKAETEPPIKELLTVTNYLVDGAFVLEQRNLSLRFRGSNNQRILDITCYPNSREVCVAHQFD